MKWLDPDIIAPSINKKYLNLDTDGRMVVREYHALKIIGTTITGRLKVAIADNEDQFDLFGFVANGADDYGPRHSFMLATRVVYYMELPEIPDIKGSVSYMNKEIKRLSDRVHLLEELLNHKEEDA